jgi:hypothetical protein
LPFSWDQPPSNYASISKPHPNETEADEEQQIVPPFTIPLGVCSKNAFSQSQIFESGTPNRIFLNYTMQISFSYPFFILFEIILHAQGANQKAPRTFETLYPKICSFLPITCAELHLIQTPVLRTVQDKNTPPALRSDPVPKGRCPSNSLVRCCTLLARDNRTAFKRRCSSLITAL